MTLKIVGATVLAELASAAAAASGSLSSGTFLELAGLLLGGGAMASYIVGRNRKKSGEDRSAAAADVSHGASEMAGAVHDLISPLREENARLHGIIAEKQQRLTARAEAHADIAVKLAQVEGEFEKRRHADAQELAILAAEIVTLKLQAERREEHIASLQVQLGEREDRRDGDRRDTDPE